ncbi:putative F-box protein (Pof7) [Aspergillus lucknowensis]|uniref:F-box domain-containing protein n=1 Tax=Aspergillus lucknowensis TaxID=176173 RepID=A0ABR4M7I4_9EURO
MDDSAELESFRRQWREEVESRAKQNLPEKSLATPSRTVASQSRKFPPTRHEASAWKEEEEEEVAPAHAPMELVPALDGLSLAKQDDEDAFHLRAPLKEPKSALEHFERAVEKEAAGNLGDSLHHYRKAYRLDAAVDKEYRNKHFAGAWKRPPQTTSSDEPTKPAADEKPAIVPTPELIASFSHLPIPPAEPLFEGDPTPPCPIANVPSEVIVEILKCVALTDPAAFGRMALVCKRFAYHFSHEQQIWKRLCQGAKFGFKAMHYSFACDIHGHAEHTLAPVARFTPFPTDMPVQIPSPLSSWSEVFHTFPRIRFTGIYISTVNYTRAGAASAYSNISWNSPIHIVTYYRYLRFYPDGTVIYLLTTVEPADVVPHINKSNVTAARAPSRKQHSRNTSDLGSSVTGPQDPVPPIALDALKRAQWGRWRLSKPASPSGPPEEPEYSIPGKDNSTAAHDPRDLVVETEGVGAPKYVYVLHLGLRSTTVRPTHGSQMVPNPSRNTKLVWKGYWSYDKLTDDWAEFGLKNDRAFVFRRVRGWGMI